MVLWDDKYVLFRGLSYRRFSGRMSYSNLLASLRGFLPSGDSCCELGCCCNADFSVAVSGLGASQEEAQSEVLVGMGLVAGSSVMVLTALWGSCLIAGRCDLVQNRRGVLVAKDKTLTRGFSLTGDISIPVGRDFLVCIAMYGYVCAVALRW